MVSFEKSFPGTFVVFRLANLFSHTDSTSNSIWEDSVSFQKQSAAVKISELTRIRRTALSWKEVNIYSPTHLTEMLQPSKSCFWNACYNSNIKSLTSSSYSNVWIFPFLSTIPWYTSALSLDTSFYLKGKYSFGLHLPLFMSSCLLLEPS